MFEAISKLFKEKEAPNLHHEPRLAVAALLVHLAAVDGSTKDEERLVVRNTLMDYYALDESEVDRLIAEATRRDADAVDLYRFTSSITSLPEEERIEIVRMMWQVVFADKQNHELEDNMVWRVAELIGVSARQRTILRNQMAKG
ncbi:MAG: TerB family tellurite resistance protein [Devosia sp.]